MEFSAWYALGAIPPVLWMAWVGRKRPLAAIRVADATALRIAHRPLRVRLVPLLNIFQLLAVLALIVGLARPRIGKAESIRAAEGVDIVLAIDLSSSMSREYIGADTRLQVTKAVIEGFIESRDEDRIGIVVFEKDAIGWSPPTLDHDALIEIVRGFETGLIADGTAIGDGIAMSLVMLGGTSAASSAIILLTDGKHNNEDSLSPEDAAQLAKARRVPVYTIGVVDAVLKETNLVNSEVDLRLLQEISSVTGGEFYQATSKVDLVDIYDEIGRLETSKVEGETFERWVEAGPLLLFAGAILLALTVALRATWLKVTP